MPKKLYLSKVIQELHGLYHKSDTNIVINDSTEEPLLVIMPYKEYLKLTEKSH